MNCLSDDLARLEELLTSAGFALGLGMADGLSPEAIEALEAKLGVAFPHEVRDLYRWKGGLLPGTGLNTPESMLFNGFHLINVERASSYFKDGASRALLARWVTEDYAGAPAKRAELSDKVPFLWEAFGDGCGSFWVLDLSAPGPSTTPVRAWTKDRDESAAGGLLSVRFDSVADLVTTSIRCYEEGAYFLIEGGFESDPLKEAQIAARLNPEVEYWRHRLEYVQANYV